MTDYDTARERLRAAELSLMKAREDVARLRRELPPGPEVPDYEFGSVDGPVRLSELFTSGDRPLVLYHFMYGKQQANPCPMCSMWTDGWNATIHHLDQRVDLAMVSAAPIDDTLALASDRGWENLRWLSAAENSFKADIGGESPDGHQMPFLSVYQLADGVPQLTYSGGAHIEDDQWRGLDLLSPIWHFLDLTRPGRGDWMPSLAY